MSPAGLSLVISTVKDCGTQASVEVGIGTVTLGQVIDTGLLLQILVRTPELGQVDVAKAVQVQTSLVQSVGGLQAWVVFGGRELSLGQS